MLAATWAASGAAIALFFLTLTKVLLGRLEESKRTVERALTEIRWRLMLIEVKLQIFPPPIPDQTQLPPLGGAQEDE